MFGQWMGDNRIKLEEDKDGEFDDLMHLSKQTLISMLRQSEKGINSLMQSRKKWKNRYYKIRKQLKEKNKIIDFMSEKIFKEGIVWKNKEEVKQYFENKTKKG